MSQLAKFIATNGPTLKLKHRELAVEGITQDGDIRVATFRSARATYPGVVRLNATIARMPGAEVWCVVGPSGRTIAEFAIHDGRLVPLTG